MKSVTYLFLFLSLFFLTDRSFAQLPNTSKFIVVDQFGYRPAASKVAVIRNPEIGFDAAESFEPGGNYAVVNIETEEPVFSGAPVAWNGGQTDSVSGDKTWWFDFSDLQTEGEYYVLDVDSNLRSFEFEIRDDIFGEVLVQAARTFFYQRSGFAKLPPFACDEWADGASHLQDKQARNFLDKGNAASEKNVSGGWYDAGDYNKYTNWTSNYVVDFMKAFMESPGVWGDDWNIPESGNNIPDILDEAKWGIDHLLRLQQANGSLLSVVGVDHASPPSAANGPSYYGLPNTSGTLNGAAAFALSSKIYRSVGMKTYADSLERAAIRAWEWALENPDVVFKNNEGPTKGLAAGQQETDDYGRLMAKLEAASYLFELTGEEKYKSFFEINYREVHLLQWTFAYPYETANQQILLYYTTIPGVSPSVASRIKSTFKSAMDKEPNFAAITKNTDPYRAFLDTYVWGSNSIKARHGLMYTDLVQFGVNPAKNTLAKKTAEDYLHYLHGVNPLNLVYLSNMYDFGAENSVNEFYHSWFTNGSTKWDRVGESTYGPAPGFLTGGPNANYDWDDCCPANCYGSSNNAMCFSESIAPPKGQPDQKSYKDFNTSWPLNSWEVTENSCGYQISYIRLLAQFVPAQYDCAGVLNGAATYDVCGVCSGGTTGIAPAANTEDCISTAIGDAKTITPEISPNPATDVININFENNETYEISILNMQGVQVLKSTGKGRSAIHINHLQSGNYIVVLTGKNSVWQKKITKLNPLWTK